MIECRGRTSSHGGEPALQREGNRCTRDQNSRLWFASIAVEVPDEVPDKKATAVSIDVGLNRLVHGGGNASVVQ
jgi:transposase